MEWWAAQVANNKEYDLKREMVNSKLLAEDDIFIPRQRIYKMNDEDVVKKRTERMIQGYVFLRLGEKPKLNFEHISNYLKILGRVTDEEMETLRVKDNVPETSDVGSGDKIIVTKGAFAGVKGTVQGQSTKEGKLKCVLVFHGNEIGVDLDCDIIDKIS